jgi:hypothetical protein
MRTIETHHVNAANRELELVCVDEPGAGGAAHHYVIKGFDTGSNPSDPFTKLNGEPADHLQVLFQNGPIQEAGVNGVTHEVLLAILIDRLEHFQAGPYACDENEHALSSLRHAQDWLKARTATRLARGVEGTHEI